MRHVIKRAVAILKKDGLNRFLKKVVSYSKSYAVYRFFPNADKKNANWHLYIKELDSRVEVMRAKPWKLELESTSICNLQCIMCPHVSIPPGTGAHFDAATLDNLEDFIASAGEFQLMGSGEPMISPSFWKIMEYIKLHHRKPPFISISSNGAAMTPHMVEKILSSPLREISFSFDAATPETYRKIRNADLSKTVNNVKHLITRRKESGTDFPFIMANMTLMRENIGELTQFIELAYEIGVDAVVFWPLHDYDPRQTADWRVERNGWTFEYRRQMLGHDAEDAAMANTAIDQGIARAEQLGLRIIWPVGGRTRIVANPGILSLAGVKSGEEPALSTDSPEPVEREDQGATPHALSECVAAWEWMLINHAGEVRPCCYIEKPFANVQEQSPEEIWNGPGYREMRRAFAKGVLPRQCKDAACKYVRGNWIYASKDATLSDSHA